MVWTLPPKMVWGVPTKMEGDYPENGTTKKETNKKENIKKDICEIFEFWKTTFSKNEKRFYLTNELEKFSLVSLMDIWLKTSNMQS